MKSTEKRYRVHLKRLLPVVMLPALAVFFLINKPAAAAPFPLASGVAESLARADGPRLVHILRNSAGRPEILGLAGTPGHPTQVLADARLGKMPSNIYKIRLNWQNGVPFPALSLQDLSLNHASSDKGLTIVSPYVAYFSALGNQIQSLNFLNTNDNTRTTFAFTGETWSARVKPLSGHKIEVRFYSPGRGWQSVTLGLTAHRVVSGSPLLVKESAATNNNSPFVRLVEAVRSHIGPGVVAFLENTWYKATDIVTRSSYTITHGHSTGNRTARHVRPSGGASSAESTVSWQEAGPSVGGHPVFHEAILHPDRARPYATVYMVKIDPALVDFHLVAGTLEPKSVTGIHGTGRIPADPVIRSRVIAAFNGGFKSQDGRFGVMVNHITYLPPQNGMATAALYANGNVNLGSWGTEVTQSPDMVSCLQNLPLILDHGAINPNIDKPKDWGVTVGNSTRVWRSGLGITRNGKLIYAAGNPVSAKDLALALKSAGCTRGMQLDINYYWVTFNFLHWTGQNGHLVGTKLTSGMHRPADRYLVPDTRDFFYLTLKKEVNHG